MPLMEWKESFSVSVQKFDDQHKKLISMINELHEAMASGKGKDVLGKILSDLISYTKNHFSEEEAEFRKHSYPESQTHLMEHDKLTKEVIKLQEDFKSGKKTLSIEVSSFLRDWLQKHILGTDKKYSSYLTSKGVK